MARPLTIVAHGDSTTAGTPGFRSPLEAPPEGRGDHESQYAYWMTRLHPEWKVLNRGVNGQRADQVLARFSRDVLAVKPDYVVVLAGVNDVYQGRPLAVVKQDLGAMYRRAREASIVPVAATVLPYDTIKPPELAVLQALNAWIATDAAGLGIPFCDTNAVVRDPTDPTRLRGSPDGLHPDVAGYRAMGEALARTIEQHITTRPE